MSLRRQSLALVEFQSRDAIRKAYPEGPGLERLLTTLNPQNQGRMGWSQARSYSPASAGLGWRRLEVTVARTYSSSPLRW